LTKCSWCTTSGWNTLSVSPTMTGNGLLNKPRVIFRFQPDGQTFASSNKSFRNWMIHQLNRSQAGVHL
jgi:hypothetical protein